VSRFAARFALVATLLMTAGGRPDDADPVRADLDRAKAAHQEAVAKARDALVAGFDAAIKEVARTGDLDAVKALQTDKQSFEATGRVPPTGRMKAAGAEYQQAVKKSKAALEKAYETAVRAYTQKLDISQADAVKAEMQAFQKGPIRGGPATPPPAAAAAPPAAPTAPTVVARPAPPQYALEYKFYEWKKGDQPVKMIHKDAGFCALVGIRGGLNGAGESAEVTVEPDGYWYVSGRATNRALEVRAVSVRIVPK
jgi:hypothetical protein